MRFRGILRILGLLICLFSATLIPPGIVALIYEDGGGVAFLLSFIVSITVGFLVWYPNRNERSDLKVASFSNRLFLPTEKCLILGMNSPLKSKSILAKNIPIL